MGKLSTRPTLPTSQELDKMHELYRKGGEGRHMAPHIIYSADTCPHVDCTQRMQAIDFRLEAYGSTVHDSLVRAWWNDTGFAGRCPQCDGWIHFTIRSKKAISAKEAAKLPQLPTDWHETALIL
jgi:hypothetical protein